MRAATVRAKDLFSKVTAAPAVVLPLDSLDESRFSPHAAQLRRGFRWLRFEHYIEREFREFYHARYLFRTRLAMIAGAVLFALFSLRDVSQLPDAVWHWTVGLRLGVIVPAILAVFGLSFVRRVDRWFEWLVALGVFLAMGGLAAAILVSHQLGAPLPYEGLMLVMVFATFVSGLRFYLATLTTFLAATGYVVARIALDLPDAETLQQAYYMFGITLVGLMGSYSLELSLRTNFLTEHVAMFRAMRDPLTHLHNRRAGFEHLQRVWRLAFRERKPVAVVLLDIDNFKAFNDQYGRIEGDGCLTEIAVALGERIRRPLDGIARYGGEEFLAVLYDVNETSLRVICEDLRLAVEGLEIPHQRNGDWRGVTISIGAAWAYPADGAGTMESALDRADGALFYAKARGRNCFDLVPAA
jgi:diguanylate cyclase (GGDEF)-like protein